MSWSALLAYMFLKRKIGSEVVPVEVSINETTTEDLAGLIFSNQVTSDNSDISKVEEYARMNKVLLSSNASVKLVKLQRLGQINISEYIKGIAMGEWIAVGENQIA